MKDTEENLVYSEDDKVLTIKIHGEIDHHSTKKLTKLTLKYNRQCCGEA